MRAFLPLPRNTQGCESVIKDDVHYKKTVRDEDKTSLIAMIRSCVISEITFKTKNDPEFMNRKRVNDKDK